MNKWILIGGGAIVAVVVVVVVFLMAGGGSAESSIAAACERRNQGNATQCACLAKAITAKLTKEDISLLSRFARARRDKEARAQMIKEVGAPKMVGLIAKLGSATKQGREQCGIAAKKS